MKNQFGPDFPFLIASNPSLLATTRYSKEKRDINVKACQREMLARKNDTVETLKTITMLTACGVTKAKARKLAAVYDPAQSPYQFFFRGGLTLLQADHVARLIDPERGAEDRIFLLIIDQSIRSQHIIVTQRDIRETVWNDFGVEWSRVDDVIEQLADLGVVRKIEWKGKVPAVIAVDARVSTETLQGDRETTSSRDKKLDDF